eukprot:164247-Chlamydomonas_euryale.AAC.1
MGGAAASCCVWEANVTENSTRCTVHCAQYSVHSTHTNSTQYTEHGTRYTVHGTRYTVQGTQYTVHGTWYTSQGTVYTVHGARYMVHGTRYTVHGTREGLKERKGRARGRDGLGCFAQFDSPGRPAVQQKQRRRQSDRIGLYVQEEGGDWTPAHSESPAPLARAQSGTPELCKLVGRQVVRPAVKQLQHLRAALNLVAGVHGDGLGQVLQEGVQDLPK